MKSALKFGVAAAVLLYGTSAGFAGSTVVMTQLSERPTLAEYASERPDSIQSPVPGSMGQLFALAAR